MDASSAQPDLSPEEGTAEEDSVSHQVQPLSKSRKKSVDASQPGPSSQVCWIITIGYIRLTMDRNFLRRLTRLKFE